ncbi:MAG TPA: tetratricopeptide repeat protein, partial [Chlamydiales bacterium]|nr:tetratricopeptide repeat protein [Chlamydiales bacterium]
MKFRYFLLFCIFLSLEASEDSKTHICLCLNVKNDQAMVWQCLQSAKETVDCVSVCDYGSTDRTIEYLRKFEHYTNIPVIIVDRQEANKSSERAMAAAAAQDALKACQLPLSSTYLLFLEPDEWLQGADCVPKESLSKDFSLVMEKSTIMDYCRYEPNLFRATLSAERIGELSLKNEETSNPSLKFRNFLILDQPGKIPDPEEANGEPIPANQQEANEWHRLNKLNRNVELFSQALSEFPDNTKILLHLAQAKKSLKQNQEAIALYKSLITKKASPEEMWFAQCMLGECYEEMGQWAQALHWYLEAYQFRPHRGESIRKIATHYRMQGQNDIAYIFAKHGLQIPHQDDNLIFPVLPLYDYQFDEEISIVAYYTRFKAEGYAAANDLLIRKTTPSHIKDQGYRNILFYAKNLKAKFQPIQVKLPRIDADGEHYYSPMNPSILKTDKGYRLIARTVNYTQTGAKHFHTLDRNGIFRTKNFLVHYDRSFNLLSQQEILEELPRERHKAFIVEGLEDCRIIDWNENTWFTCTTFDTNPTGAIQVSLCKLPNKTRKGPLQVESLLPLEGPDPNRHEKNWLPFLKDGEIHIVYLSDPMTIYKPDLETGFCTTVIQNPTEYDFSRFRGSAAPIAFDGGYLMLIHEVVQFSDYTRNY